MKRARSSSPPSEDTPHTPPPPSKIKDALTHPPFPILVESVRKKRIPSSSQVTINVTSRSSHPTFVKFSPFYPLGNLPVPGSDWVSESVEGVWQGLKLFEKEGVDHSKFRITNMKKIKRAMPRGKGRISKRGAMVGHYAGRGKKALSYVEARKKIYVPTYHHALKNKLRSEVPAAELLYSLLCG
eukprot:TRINITY_DN2612_c0_g1_i1.p1 TRINITY_DN2612_c0_g1~~TRINITY_DN2612_c0_g1_i1.p1  ORF type:complete len:196 (+),score=50.16 TRINITY_DN2612_c0_g1_i1:38-589(+)